VISKDSIESFIKFSWSHQIVGILVQISWKPYYWIDPKTFFCSSTSVTGSTVPTNALFYLGVASTEDHSGSSFDGRLEANEGVERSCRRFCYLKFHCRRRRHHSAIAKSTFSMKLVSKTNFWFLFKLQFSKAGLHLLATSTL